MDNWLSAAEAMKRAESIIDQYSAKILIASRAHAGMIRTKAQKLIKRGGGDCWRLDKDEVVFDEILPADFWRAEGHDTLERNWESGDFAAWIEERGGNKLYPERINRHWQAYGVLFARDGIEELLKPSESAGVRNGKVSKKVKNKLPSLSRTTLNKWWESLANSRDAMSQGELLDDVRHKYPDNSISRQRIRDLTKGRKRGPKQ